MKRILALLLVVFLMAICVQPVLASSDDSSSDSSSDDSSDDSSSDSSSDDSSDDSSSDSSSDDSSDDSSSDSSPDDSSDDSSSDSSPDDSSDDSSSDSSSDGRRDDSPDRQDDSQDDSLGRSDDWRDDSPDISDDSRSREDLTDEILRIRETASEREIELEQELSQYSGDDLLQMSGDKDVRVTVYTLQQAGSIPNAGAAAPELASIADEINRLADDSLSQEDRIQGRSGLVRFFIGGDQAAAASLERDADAIELQITRLNQILATEDLDDALKPVLQDQIQVLIRERDHLRDQASREREDRGLFGGIFS